MEDKKRFSVTLPLVFWKGMDMLVDEGLFLDRQHLMRVALRDIFEKNTLDLRSIQNAMRVKQ